VRAASGGVASAYPELVSEGVSTDRDPRAGAPGARGALSLVLSPRWIAWHLLSLGAMVTCGLLAAWQWRRAGTALGSAVNVGYGLQWPVFAVFFGWMWWRMLRIELQRLRETATAPAAAAPPARTRSAEPASAEPASPGPAPSGAEAAEAGPPDRAPAHAGPARTGAPTSPAHTGAAPPGGPSPFVYRPGRVRAATDVDDPELAEYNRMLAALAARDQEPQD
jgi:DNA-binding transcriptional regulator of glucitol operon